MSAVLTRRAALQGSAGAALGLVGSICIPMQGRAAPAFLTFPNPDAALIEFAGRVARLAQREDHVRGQMVDAQGPIDKWDFANKPRQPKSAEIPSRTAVVDLSTPTHRILQWSEAREPDPAQVAADAADAAYRTACETHQRAVEARLARSRAPRLEKLADRMVRRLVRDVDRLADMRPSTAAGLAAKAAAVVAIGARNCGALDKDECRLALSIAADAVRLHCNTLNITGDARHA